MSIFRYIVIGRHQILALMLLALFAAQGAWLVHRRGFSTAEQDHIWSGRQQMEYGAVPRSFRYTPLTNVASAAPLRLDANRKPAKAVDTASLQREVQRLHWLTRFPFLIAGILLGVSVWYVARRLYGNPGGYIALVLYCFSPAMIARSSVIDEAVISAWGVFGIIFTAIAISHNLYAPWKKWRYRTLLLAVAITLAVASHPAAVLLVPLAGAFILYLAPGRRLAGSLMLLLAMTFAAFLVSAAYSFVPRALLNGVDLRQWLAYDPAAARKAILEPAEFFLRFNPAVLWLLISSVVTYFVWRRTRYFGNTSPLIVAALLLYLSLISPMSLTASLWALPFVFVFIGGIWADLLETNRRWWVLGALLILLGENVWYCWKMVQAV